MCDKDSDVTTAFNEAEGGEACRNCGGIEKAKSSASNSIEYENLLRSNRREIKNGYGYLYPRFNTMTKEGLDMDSKPFLHVFQISFYESH
ncbi:MAG: hypothetical protein WBL68_07685 [Nitrososphaeraceae archaeon]